jgi:S1-C subfamily serine protease
MDEIKKLTFYNATAIFLVAVIFTLLLLKINHDFNQSMIQQKSDYESKINTLTETMNNNIGVLQTLMQNSEEANKARDDNLAKLINQVSQSSEQSLSEVKSDLQKEIANIEVSNTDFSKIAQQSLPSVVSVLTDIGQGSGAIITEDGQIVTNYHVISGSQKINVVTYSHDIYRVDVIGYDEDIDIALLKIRGNETFRELSFADSDKVKVGESVVALGNPYGLDFTVTQGIISARRRASNNLEYLQIDVAINPGNSGGPIIDSTGKIVGLANFRIQGGEGLGFALPSNTVVDTVNDIT